MLLDVKSSLFTSRFKANCYPNSKNYDETTTKKRITKISRRQTRY